MKLTTRTDKGSKLSIQEMDDNLLYLESLIDTVDLSGKVDKETGKSLLSDTEITRLVSLNNNSLTTESFTFGASQSFVLANTVLNIVSVNVQTGGLHPSQYTLQTPKTILINDTLVTGDKVTVTYNYASVTQAQLAKMPTWSAGAYATGDQVNHLGKDWTANAATAAGDVPGTSSKWTERLSGYAVLNEIIDTTFYDNLFDKSKIVYGYYGTNGVTYQDNSNWRTSDFIAVTAGENYKRVNTVANDYVYLYKSDKTPFSTIFVQPTDANLINIPTGVAFVKIMLRNSSIDTTMFTLSTVDTSVYIPYSISKIKSVFLPKINIINTWLAKAYLIGDQVNYLGKDWTANAATIASDIPATSTKWTERLTGYTALDKITDTVIPDNLFDKSKFVYGYYGTNGVTYQASTSYWTSDFMPVTAGISYKRIITLGNNQQYIYYYDANKAPLSPAYVVLTSNTMLIPTGVAFVKILFNPADTDKVMFTISTVNTSVYIPYAPLKIKPILLPSSPVISAMATLKQIHNSDVGALDYQEIDSTDYSHIILYGQSLSMGWEAPRSITSEAISGNFMVGTAPYYYGENLSATALNPLVANKNNVNMGEQPIVSLTNAFSKLYRRFVNKEQLFIGSNPCQDGRSIEKLSKECTNGSTVTDNLYNQRYQKLLTDTKNIVAGLGKTVSCPAILYMQGEYNYIALTGNGLTAGTDATPIKANYKALLMTLKNNMQADAMTTYGQTKKPLFFIYEVAGSYINRLDMSINMAQIEFAKENDDVFLLNPTYFTSDYNGGHLSTNGYRWYGEIMAKSLYNVFIKGNNLMPIYPEVFEVVDNVINIDFSVPVLPMKFDTKTTPLMTSYGFKVVVNNAVISITSVVISNNRVIITCPNVLSGNIEIVYAGTDRSGAGNLRDSDSYLSMYKYFDDSVDTKKETYTPQDESGVAIYGKSYPMYNWCSNFYKLLTV